MSSPAVLFTAIIAVFFSLQISCNPAPSQDLDFQSLLDQIQQQQRKSKDREVNDKYDTNFHDEETHHYGSLKSKEILDLIQQATQNNANYRYDDGDLLEKREQSRNRNGYKDNKSKGRYYYLYKELNENNLNDGLLYNHESNVKNRNKYNEYDERDQKSRFNEEALEQLLSENVVDKKYRDQPRFRLVPNSLVSSPELKLDREDDHNSPGGYSKVYVILNPKAIAKSGDKVKLNSLLEKILSLTSSDRLDQEAYNGVTRYKGFPVLPGLAGRRARRDSREMYGKESVEEEYKPKRPRNERGSGGGGGGGRTAIPYIRHRGDIYEREN